MNKIATLHAQQMWEYMEITRKTETYLTGELNDVGQQGWELVSITHGKDRKGETAWTAFLKRPFIPQEETAPQHATQAAEQTLQAGKIIQPTETESATDTDDEEFRLQDE